MSDRSPEERAAIAEHDGEQSREEAEALAAREQGFDGADDLHHAAVAHWTQEIARLGRQGAANREADEALKGAELLGRHLAMFTDKSEQKVSGELVIEVVERYARSDPA